MLKHILKNVKLKHLGRVAKNISTNYNIPFLNRTQILKPNHNGQNVLYNIPRFVTNKVKFVETENTYAFNIINKESLNKSTLDRSDEVVTLKEFSDLLCRNWRESTSTDIVKAFKSVKSYCIQNNINISDPRFDSLVDGLMDHCEELSDDELLDLLFCLSQYPLCDSYTSHNFHDVWSCLDDICCWKMVEWDVDKMFVVANLWYKLNLGRLCDYIFVLIDRLTKKAEVLTKDELVKIYFYFNICRKRAVDFEYEYALEKQINNMNVDEMAVVALGYFKTKTKIKLASILECMIRRVIENSENIQEIALTGIMKILQYSKPAKLAPQVNDMLDKLYYEIDRLSDLGSLHIALVGTGFHMLHKKTLQKVSEKLVKDINIPEKVRIKDIERMLNVLSMFDFDPKTEPDIYRAAYNELHSNQRLAEIIRYPRCLGCALNYLSLRNIYSYELMDKVLNIDYVNEIYGKSAKLLPRELFTLDASIDIECPGYKGNRLPLALKYKAAKWLTDFTPSYDQYKKITAAEQLVLDTIDTVKVIMKDENLIYIDHVLPHYTRADIILCKDKSSGKFVQPRGFENYVLGDVMFPINDGSLEFFAIVILGLNNTIKDSSLPLGNMIMKKRQLEKIGYRPVFVIWNEFLRLSKEDQVEYILRKIT